MHIPTVYSKVENFHGYLYALQENANISHQLHTIINDPWPSGYTTQHPQLIRINADSFHQVSLNMLPTRVSVYTLMVLNLESTRSLL